MAKIVTLLFTLIFILSGFILLGVGVMRWNEGMASKGWTEVAAKVESAEVTKTRSKNKRYRYHARITYKYEAQGVPYTGTKVGLTGQESGSESHANKLVRDYAVNKTVKAYHDPAHPGKAVLIRGVGGSVYVVFVVGLVFLAIGFYLTFRGLWKRAPDSPPAA